MVRPRTDRCAVPEGTADQEHHPADTVVGGSLDPAGEGLRRLQTATLVERDHAVARLEAGEQPLRLVRPGDLDVSPVGRGLQDHLLQRESLPEPTGVVLDRSVGPAGPALPHAEEDRLHASGSVDSRSSPSAE